MRCIECVTEPITPGYFCECCGRKLSLEERKGLDQPAVPVEPVVAAETAVSAGPVVPAEPAPSALRCESCGAPSDEGTLCANCRQVFQPFLNSVPPQPEWRVPVVEPTSQVAEVPVPARFDPVMLESALEAAAARPEAGEASPVRADVVKTEAVRSEIAPEAVAPEPVKPHAVPAQPAAAKVAPVEKPRPAPKAAVPAPAKRAAAPAQARRNSDWMIGIAAAVVVVAALGVGWGAFWAKAQREPIAAPPPQSSPAAAAAPVAEVATVRPEVLEAAAKVQEDIAARERAAARPPAAAKAKPAASSATFQKAQPKAVRQPAAPAPQVAPVVAPARVEAPVREVEAPTPAPVAAASVSAAASAASIAPLRPFFEAKDVNEAPTVASRVEPRLPDELQGHSVSDVVVVRLLVSQSGHPSSISLLRKSKTGQSLDDAVVAAVKQWMFSPAKKKGEAVSCWLNVGVPVGRAN